MADRVRQFLVLRRGEYADLLYEIATADGGDVVAVDDTLAFKSVSGTDMHLTPDAVDACRYGCDRDARQVTDGESPGQKDCWTRLVDAREEYRVHQSRSKGVLAAHDTHASSSGSGSVPAKIFASRSYR